MNDTFLTRRHHLEMKLLIMVSNACWLASILSHLKFHLEVLSKLRCSADGGEEHCQMQKLWWTQ